MSIYTANFLKSIGFHGLGCAEKGEDSEVVYPWEKSMSYVIFYPRDIEIISEEHFGLKNGKLIRVK